MRRLTAALLLLALATVAACGASTSNTLRSKTQRVGCDACHTTWY